MTSARARWLLAPPIALLLLLDAIAIAGRSDDSDDVNAQVGRSSIGASTLTSPEGASAASASAGPSLPLASVEGADRGAAPAGDARSAPGRAGQADPAAEPRIPVGAGAPGVTDTTIEIGIGTLNTAAANAVVASATGNPSAFDPDRDFRKSAQSVVDYINANGGVAGREIVPVFHEGNVANETTRSGRDQEDERRCAAWTQDRHVFAMLTGNGSHEGLFACAKATNTVVLTGTGDVGGGTYLSASMFEEFHDLYYGPSWLLTERRETNLVDGLWSQGFFDDGAKVGLLIEDTRATLEGVTNGMLPALARHGIEPAVQIVYPDPISSPWSNYVLQFQSAGVDHVIMSSSFFGTTSTLFIMKAADQQQYNPHWGLTTDNGPAFLAGYGIEHRQLASTQGIGWIPLLDVGDTTLQSANAAICDKIGKDAGQPPGATLGTCERLFFLKYALDRASEISAAGMSAALARVGDGYDNIWTIGGATSFGPDRHDGASVVRDFGYDDRCGESGNSCIEYTSEPRTMR